LRAFSTTRRRFITTACVSHCPGGKPLHSLMVSTIRFRKPRKLGTSLESWLSTEGRDVLCGASTCLYLLRNLPGFGVTALPFI